MKKALSLILAVVMLLCSVSLSTAGAVSEQLVLNSEFLCNYNGEPLVYTFTPTQDITAVIYSITDDEETDPLLTVFCNGEYLNESDDDGKGYNYFLRIDFTAGNTYTFETSDYNGTPCQWTTVFKEPSVESIEIISVPGIYSDLYGNAIVNFEGTAVQLNYTDSSVPSKTVVFSEDHYETEVDGLILSLDFDEELSIFTASYEGVSDTVEVTVNKKTVTDFKIITPPVSNVLYEDLDCMKIYLFDEVTGTYVEAYIYSPKLVGATARITYDDETFTDLSYNSDPLFFLALENDLDSQLTNAWSVGTHTVTFSYEGFSDTVTFELKKNPYVSAEITKLPDNTKSLFEGVGYYTYDADFNSYFHYDTLLSGINVSLKDENGNETKITDDFSVTMKLTAVTDQETDHWNVGEHTVDVYYGNMYIGSYTYTVSDVTLTDIDILTKAEGAFYYADTDDTAFLEDGLSVKLTLSDGSTKNVNVKDFMTSNAGTILNVCEEYDETEENYYYTVCNEPSGLCSEAVYYTKLSRSVTSIYIVTPPAKMTYVYDYGIDVYSLDLSGLTVDIYWSDDSVDTWTYSDEFEDGIGVFNNTVIRLQITNDYITCSAGICNDTYYSEDYKNIKEYSLGTISKNTEMTVDLGISQITVYTFTPWDDGTYYFTSDGEKYSVIAVYDEYGSLLRDLITTDHILNGSTKAELSFDCIDGETYYILLEVFDLFENEGDTDVDFIVDHTVLGDTNGDGRVALNDVLLIRKHIAYIVNEDGLDIDAADVNGDGRVTISDVLLIRKYIAGIVTEFPRET